MRSNRTTGGFVSRVRNDKVALVALVLVSTSVGCLEEEGPGAGLGGPSVSTAPGSPTQPRPDFEAAKPSGLFGANAKYMYIWPTGRFVLDTPKKVDGEFDEAATTDYYRDQFIGRITSATLDKDGVYKLSARLDTGKVFEARSFPSGYVHFPVPSVVDFSLPPYTESFILVRPVDAAALSGVFFDKWNESVTSSPGAGQSGIDIYTGGSTFFEFKPGNRVQIRYKSYVSTNVVVGTPGGGTTGTNDGDLSRTNIDGEGSYRLNGVYMTVDFDSGDVITDILYLRDTQYLGRQLVFGTIYAFQKQKK